MRLDRCIPHAVFGHPVDQVPGEDDVADQATLQASLPRLRACVARLPLRDRTVICLRFGLAGADPHSLREIAKYLGLSVGTVHATERHALELLREWF